MDNYVAIVVDDEKKAFDTLHKLWALNADGSLIVRGAAVVRRDANGRIELVSKESDTGERTVVGMAAGLLIGAIVAAGAMTVFPIAIGTAVGAATGIAAEAVHQGEHRQVESETPFILPPNAAAVLAEVSEDTTTLIDSLTEQAGGKVYRRTRSTVLNDQWFGEDSNLSLYTYDYGPGVSPKK